jgi:excisionase family DNA binding protein
MSIYFTEREVAQELRVSLASLRRWRVENRGPRYVKVGSLVRYSVRDLEEWLAGLPSGGISGKKEPQTARPRREKFAS